MGEEMTEWAPYSYVLRGGEAFGKSSHWYWLVLSEKNCGRVEEMT